MSTQDWLGIGVATCLAGALASLLLWAAGRSAGKTRAELLGALATIWIAIIACVAGLLLVRMRIGGGIVDYDPQGPAPIRARGLGESDMIAVVAGLAWAVLWLVVALRTARKLSDGGAPPEQQ